MSKIVLYGTPPSRAARPIWLLHEMGATDAVEIRPVDFQKGEHKSPEFLKINPLGVVPALIDGDLCLSESIAIMHYLLKRLYQEGRFVPFDNAQRSVYDTCITLTADDMDNSVLRVFAMKFFLPPDKHNHAFFAYCKDIFESNCITVLSSFLEDSEFLCGQQFTAADVVVGYTLYAANILGWLKEHTIVYNYFLRLANRPAFQTAILTEEQRSQLPPPPPVSITKPRFFKIGNSKPVLYTYPMSRGQRVVWLIHECGLSNSIDIKVVNLLKGENKSPEYLKIHPGGLVPCLADGELVITESASIMQYILRRFNKWTEMAPFDIKALAKWERVLYMTLGSVDGSILTTLRFTFQTRIGQQAPDDVRIEYWKSIWDSSATAVEALLEEGEYATGNKFQAVDCLLGFSLNACAKYFPQWLEPYPLIRAYVQRLQQRKGYLLTWPKPKPKLFHDPISRSNRVMWLLEEAGLVDEVDIQEVKLTQGEHKKPEFLKVNPAGQVPALVEPDGYAVSESVAICEYLLERFGKLDDWVPTDIKRKGQCKRFLYLTVGSADSTTFDAIVYILFTPPNKFDVNYFSNLKKKWEASVASPLEIILKDTEWLLGDKFTLADVCLGFSLVTASRMGWTDNFTNVSAYVSKLVKRPAFIKVFPKPLDPIGPVVPNEVPNVEKEALVVPSRPIENELPKIVIYHVPLTRSTRVLWLLREIGGDILKNVQVNKVGWDYVKTKEFFAINPNQLVPAAKVDETPMFEAGAIIHYICEQLVPDHPVIKTLFPPTWNNENWLRHHVYSYWTIVHVDKEIISNFFGLSRFTGKISGKVEKWFQKVVSPKILADLGDNDYINGPTFTCTDIYVGYSLFLAYNLQLFSKTGKIGAYYSRLISREAFNGILSEK